MQKQHPGGCWKQIELYDFRVDPCPCSCLPSHWTLLSSSYIAPTGDRLHRNAQEIRRKSMGWFMPRRSRSFAGSHGRRFPRRCAGPSRVPARVVLLLLVMVAALAPQAFAQATPNSGARWTPDLNSDGVRIWTHDVTTMSLIGKPGLQQSVEITGGSMIWSNAAIDACPWTRVDPPLPSTSCDSLKAYGAIPGEPFRNRPLTVTNFDPTQAMIDNGGVVIRLRWQGYSSPAGGNVGMTEWVPLRAPERNAALVLTPAAISENSGVSAVTATLARTTTPPRRRSRFRPRRGRGLISR